VYYTCFGGGAAEACVTVGLEAAVTSRISAAASASSSDSAALSSAAPATPPAVAEAFAATPPSIGLYHNSCGQAGLDSAHQPVRPTRSAFDEASATWRVWFRPKKPTGSHLAQVRVQWAGANVVMSGGFEVRTKPHKWMLVQNLPAEARAADVEAYLERCHRGLAGPIVTVVRPVCADGAPADASLPHAFVQLKDRSAAHDVMKGYRALRGASSSSGGVVVSFLAGLSRAVAEDPSLQSVAVPVPSLACPAFVQQPAGVERALSQDTVELPPRASKRSRDSDDEDSRASSPSLEGKRSCPAANDAPRSPSPASLSMSDDAGSVGSFCSSLGLGDESTWRPASAAGTLGSQDERESSGVLPVPVLPVAMPRWTVAGHLAAPGAMLAGGIWAHGLGRATSPAMVVQPVSSPAPELGRSLAGLPAWLYE